MKIHVKTAQREFDIEVFSGFLKNSDIEVNRENFAELCKKGCVNFGKKWCCPPYAPRFDSLARKEGIFAVLFRTDLNQIKSTPYNRMRIANVVMKSRIEKLMRELEREIETIFLSNGSCRLCKPCKKKINEPCAYPEKKRYSLEATGVDCANLAEKLGVKLEWFPVGQSTCVICGLVCDENEVDKIENKITN